MTFADLTQFWNVMPCEVIDIGPAATARKGLIQVVILEDSDEEREYVTMRAMDETFVIGDRHLGAMNWRLKREPDGIVGYPMEP